MAVAPVDFGRFLMLVLTLALFFVPRAGGQDSSRFVSLVTLAFEAEREGRLEVAAAAFREAALLEPDVPYVHYSLALLLVQQGLLTDALAAVDRALELDPDQAPFHLARGTIFHTLSNLGEAERAYQNALDLDPDSSDAFLSLAELYLATDKL